MASVGRDRNGHKRILFVAADESRKTVRLGRVNIKTATAIKSRVEALLTVQVTGVLDSETAVWLAGVDDTLHARLAAVGLVEPRQRQALRQRGAR